MNKSWLDLFHWNLNRQHSLADKFRLERGSFFQAKNPTLFFQIYHLLFSGINVALCSFFLFSSTSGHHFYHQEIRQLLLSFRGLESWESFSFNFSVEMPLFLNCQRLIFAFNFNSVRSPSSFFSKCFDSFCSIKCQSTSLSFLEIF